MKKVFLAILPMMLLLRQAMANEANAERQIASTDSFGEITPLQPEADSTSEKPAALPANEESDGRISGGIVSANIPEKPVFNPIGVYDALYVFGQKRLYVLDFMNEEKPDLLCSLELPFTATNAVFSAGVDGVKCLEFFGNGGKKSAIDISDVFSPVVIPEKGKLCDIKYGESGFPQYPLHFADMDESAKILSIDGDEIRVFKKTGSGVFSEVTVRRVHGGIVKDIFFDSFLYVAEGTRGIGIYGIDEFGLISHVKQIVLPKGSAEKLLLAGNVLYVAAGEVPVYEICVLPQGRFSSPVSHSFPFSADFYFDNIFYGESEKNIVVESSSNEKTAYFDIEKRTIAIQED